ncbi:UNVERIFIED_ORG: transcriptional regulator with XRE-family HTH domain [Bacillus sp. 1751]|nr:transcriptional regulator with XRE-family HTH domain [Bacillus sp. 1751]
MHTKKIRLPYNMEYNYKFIKPIRMARNKTQSEFSNFMNVDTTTICKLERGQLDFTPYYDSKFKNAIKQLRVSNTELVSIRKILEIKA